MPQQGLTRQQAEEIVRLLSDAVRAGYSLVGSPSALATVAATLKISLGAARNRMYRAKTVFGLEPAAPVEEAPTQVTLAERHSSEAHIRALRRERDELRSELSKVQTLRREVMRLADPIEPVSFTLPPDRSADAEIIVSMLSDIQYGEVVNLDEMDGVNSFSVEIADVRIERYFAGLVSLATRHWSGPPPARLVLVFGGDMISGEIHEELKRTNELNAIPALRRLAGRLIAGIAFLLEHLDCPVDIISLPGNHGRTSFKPESKGYAALSYDTLLTSVVEMHFAASGQWRDRLNFFIPSSGDAVFSIFGWRVLATHGDRIGSRGGAGFVGPAATVARGFKKLQMDYGARGIHVDFMLCGHFHTTLALEEGWVNGTLVGPSQYSRDWRYRPRPATQIFLSFHPSRGVTQQRLIQVGDPSEGIIYRAPASMGV